MQQAFTTLCQHILPVDTSLHAAACARLDNLTKPQGSLGRLEEIAARLYCIAGGVTPLQLDPAAMFTVAGDHGVVAEQVAIFPQTVTRQMVQNFLNNGAGINVLSRAANIDLHVVDAGCAGGPFAPHPMLLDRRLGDGSANIAVGPAMSREICLQGLLQGAELADSAANAGKRCVGVGEMGIANTTPATALYCALLDLTPEIMTGPGAGASAEMIQHKIQVIHRALRVNTAAVTSGDPVAILAALGGFEIATMAGIMLGAARRRMAVVVDGFISTAAYVVARALCPAVEGYAFLSHASAEPGYTSAVEALHNSKPLLHLGLRLGEGTGAALAIPLLRASAAIFNEMATFDQANVSKA
ncbi:MAG: nicotinate-nucleotide--dimethylbenzimidazole phosphoribosyltransferase [Desulfovibrionaceae bacterium]